MSHYNEHQVSIFLMYSFGSRSLTLSHSTKQCHLLKNMANILKANVKTQKQVHHASKHALYMEHPKHVLAWGVMSSNGGLEVVNVVLAYQHTTHMASGLPGIKFHTYSANFYFLVLCQIMVRYNQLRVLLNVLSKTAKHA